MIAALYVQTNGIYANVPGIDPWDAGRDARKYIGPHPVIAHPPCQLWGKFAKINFMRWGGEHNKPGNDGGCFAAATLSVIAWGGVLEHPAQSYAFKAHGIPAPNGHGWQQIGKTEYVCEVWQSAYGHLANKRTWLFYSGKNPPFELDWRKVKGSHQIGDARNQRSKESQKPILRGHAASATPIAFRDELIRLALHSR